jgi:hypothetical protein
MQNKIDFSAYVVPTDGIRPPRLFFEAETTERPRFLGSSQSDSDDASSYSSAGT